MKASGRNNPCPCCGRNINGSCRWNDDTILCFHGETFSPPSDLRPGDTITINGKPWALIRRDGGFSGMAAVFKPHRERSKGVHKTDTPNTAQELLSRQTKRSQWAHILDQFHNAFDAAWDAPDFYTATPDELHSACAAITDAQVKAAALKPHLRTIWRDHDDLSQLHRLRVEAQLKSIAYIAEDLRQFQQNELGLPCPAAVQELLEASQ
ncbi:MAG: hypothetical protein CBB80_010595 [Synechococcus sp. TMED20]|nr:MAG: hypothetical protein CBB80_010595 [Synechococcus sp. TMED20]